MAKIIHLMLRVNSIDKAVEFYRCAFNFHVRKKIDFEEFTLLYLRNNENDFEIELTYNKNMEEPYTHGTAYGHAAFVVDDIENEYERLMSEGYGPNEINELYDSRGVLVAKFFFILDPDGNECEVIQRCSNYK